MKREIKFKAKVKYNGNHLLVNSWVFGSVIYKTSGVFIYVIEEDDFGNVIREFETEVINETVCQFTGLKDKNGVDVFEGDVEKSGCVIHWCYHRNGWALASYDSTDFVTCHCYDCEGDFEISEDIKDLEITVNIHD